MSGTLSSGEGSVLLCFGMLKAVCMWDILAIFTLYLRVASR